MEIKPFTCKEKTNSRDLLQTLYATQESCLPLKSFKVHKVTSKCQAYQLPSNKENKKKISIAKDISKQFQNNEKILLTKHRNKIQENINLHRTNKLDYNFYIMDNPGHISRSAVASLHGADFFTPKTKDQIISSHFEPDRQSGCYQGNIKHSYHQSINFDTQGIKYSQSTSNAFLTPKLQNKKFLEKTYDNNQKQIHKNSIQSISSISKSNSFFTLANISGHQLSRDNSNYTSLD